MTWLGLDIGGANLKAANTAGWASSMPFALWRDPGGLTQALSLLLEQAPHAECIAVTMTGELCDCFRTKAEGVRHILAAVDVASLGTKKSVYLLDGTFATIAAASETPQLAAASNWHALAQFACRYVSDSAGLLIDVGSTTTDIIPLVNGHVAARGRNDTERLAARELVYTGVGRTPLCAIAKALPWRGQSCPTAAEVFSTTADAYIVLGDVPEDAEANWTADGRPLTIECARQRLARQLCGDMEEFEIEDFECMADAVRKIQINQIVEGITTVVGNSCQPKWIVLGGAGEFLSRKAVLRVVPDCRIVTLTECLGIEISRCAPAYAVAILADEAASHAP